MSRPGFGHIHLSLKCILWQILDCIECDLDEAESMMPPYLPFD